MSDLPFPPPQYGNVDPFYESFAKLNEAQPKPTPLRTVVGLDTNNWTDELNDILDHIIDMEQPLPPPEYLGAMNGVSILQRGDLSTIRGKAKTGKSHGCYIIAAALLRGVFGVLQRASADTIRILIFDTEQNPCDVQQRIGNLCRLADISPRMNHEELLAYSAIHDTEEQRIERLEELIKRHHSDFVILDGVRDLMHNFNDIEETAKVMGKLRTLAATYKCNIMSVIHENPSDQSNKGRGHIGTELTNKVSDGFRVEYDKDNEWHTVSHIDHRHKCAGEFSFVFGVDGLPAFIDAANVLNQRRVDTLRKEIARAFISLQPREDLAKKSVKRTELRDALQHDNGLGRSTNFEKIKTAIERGLVLVTGAGKDERLTLAHVPNSELFPNGYEHTIGEEDEEDEY